MILAWFMTILRKEIVRRHRVEPSIDNSGEKDFRNTRRKAKRNKSNTQRKRNNHNRNEFERDE